METLDLFEGLTSSAQTSSAVDSLASTYLAPVIGKELTAEILACGTSSLELFARLDLEASSWRMLQRSFFEGSADCSAIWPRSGLMLSGTAYQLAPLVRIIRATGRLLWPTPTAGDAKSSGSRNTPQSKAKDGISLTDAVRMDKGKGRQFFSTLCAGDSQTASPNQNVASLGRQVRRASGRGGLNPQFCEWLMGFPIGWTELDASEMPLCPRSRKSSGAQSSKRKS